MDPQVPPSPINIIGTHAQMTMSLPLENIIEPNQGYIDKLKQFLDAESLKSGGLNLFFDCHD